MSTIKIVSLGDVLGPKLNRQPAQQKGTIVDLVRSCVGHATAAHVLAAEWRHGDDLVVTVDGHLWGRSVKSSERDIRAALAAYNSVLVRLKVEVSGPSTAAA